MESQDEIKQRLLRVAARAWGHEESQMDLEAFDPLVRLMVNAQASEFARLDRRLVASEERILERMLEQLSPEVLVGPRPAHAIASARSIRPVDTIDPSHQLFFTKDTGREKVDVHFLPLDSYKVFNLRLKTLEIGGRALFTQAMSGTKERLLRQDASAGKVATTMHLGLEVDGQVKEVDGLRLYFHWLNSSKQTELLLYLKMARFSVNGIALEVEEGLVAERPERRQELESALSDEYSRYAQTKREIQDEYNDNFVTIRGWDVKRHGDVAANKKFYPEELENSYGIDQLAVLDDKLLWIKVEFPLQFPPETLQSTICAANAYPIAGFQLHEQRGNLRDQVNIVPLPTEEYYFDVIGVENAAGQRYHEIPLTNIRNYAAGEFSVRYRDVAKLDKRAASLAVMDLLDALRDESSAFSAYGLDTMNTKITELNQNIKNLEQLVLQQEQTSGHLAFIIAKPKPRDRYVTVDYLSSCGELANGVLAQSKLELRRSGRVHRKSIYTLTSTRGGTRPLGSQGRKYAYKKAIISRGRVVSREDVRAFCYAHFVNELAHVDIKKGYSTGLGPNQGLMRTIEVKLRFTPQALEAGGHGPLHVRMAKLERELNRNTSAVLPIRVISPELPDSTITDLQG